MSKIPVKNTQNSSQISSKSAGERNFDQSFFIKLEAEAKIATLKKLFSSWAKNTHINPKKDSQSLKSGQILPSLKNYLWNQTKEFWTEFEKEIKKNRNRTSKYRIPLSLKTFQQWKQEKFSLIPIIPKPTQKLTPKVQHGLIVALIKSKTLLKTKRGESFYKLEIEIKKNLTHKILTLTFESCSLSLNSSVSLLVFINEHKWAYTLEKNLIYAFWVLKYPNSTGDYWKVRDWRKLGDCRTIERTLQLIAKEKPTELLTNQELLSEVKNRLGNSISCLISAAKSGKETQLDIDLKDEKSNYCLPLNFEPEK